MPKMMNLDKVAAGRTEILSRMATAIREENAGDFNGAFNDLADNIQEGLRGEFEELRSMSDQNALAARGVRVLTGEEVNYYNTIMEAWGAKEPRQAISNANVALPETVVNSVFEDVQKEHPLLGAINFQNTGALAKLLLSTSSGVAGWGALGSAVNKEVTANFIEVDLTAAQLTAYIPVAKYMLEMGPNWMDNYVRTLLAETVALQLEAGVVDGTGKEMPIGMDRKLTGASDSVYPLKTATKITDLSPETFGTILAALAKDASGNARPVAEIGLVVNPADYFTKIMPASTPRATDGSFTRDVFPFPTTVYQSAACPSGKAIFGIMGKYFLGCGIGTEGGKMEFSDDVKFLERQRVYLTYLYGNGRALDENAFYLADISTLTPYVQQVTVKGTVSTKEQA